MKDNYVEDTSKTQNPCVNCTHRGKIYGESKCQTCKHRFKMWI